MLGTKEASVKAHMMPCKVSLSKRVSSESGYVPPPPGQVCLVIRIGCVISAGMHQTTMMSFIIRRRRREGTKKLKVTKCQHDK